MKFYSLELQPFFDGMGKEELFEDEYEFIFQQHEVKKISEFYMWYRSCFSTFKQDIYSLNKVFQDRSDFLVVFLDKREIEKQKKRLLKEFKEWFG